MAPLGQHTSFSCHFWHLRQSIRSGTERALTSLHHEKNIIFLLFLIASLISYTPVIEAQTFHPEPQPVEPTAQEVEPTVQNGLSPTTAGLIVAGSYVGGLLALSQGVKSDNDLLITAGLTGVFLAPPFGYGYSQETLKGIGLSAISVLGSVMQALSSWRCNFGCTNNTGNSGMATVGIALHVGANLFALIDAPNAAKRTNKKWRRFMLAPTTLGKNIGLGATGRF